MCLRRHRYGYTGTDDTGAGRAVGGRTTGAVAADMATGASSADGPSVGRKVICYVDVGSYESFRADADEFPASVLGKSNGAPGERWLDVRRIGILKPIMAARFAACAKRGFDGIEADNVDGYANDTGFALTADD